jgi:hypothetical protein
LVEGEIHSRRMENATSFPPEVKKPHSPFSENENLIFCSRLSPFRNCAFTSLRFFICDFLSTSMNNVPRLALENPQQLFILREIFILRGGVTTRAQHLPSNLYPYPDHNHQQRPIPTHAHPCYSNCARVLKNCVMCVTRLHQVLVGSNK